MKIGEARQIYSAQLHNYWDQKLSLARKKKELEAKSIASPNGKEGISREKVTLELSYHAVSQKCDEYQDFMDQLMCVRSGYYNAQVSKQQGDLMSEQFQDVAKLMEVARRISKGGRVPVTDEQKLMEYSMVLYLSAKNMAMMNELKDNEEYDSLWDDKKDTKGDPDPNEIADNEELTLKAPEVVDVVEVMASAVSGNASE